MKKILIIHKTQFGYHTDYYKWCEYLRDKYRIDIICFNSGRPKVVMDGIKVHYVKPIGFRQLRGIIFILYSVLFAAMTKRVTIVGFFNGCNFIKLLLPYKKLILDIRTFSVNPDDGLRVKENKDLFRSVKLYDYVTIISDGLRKKLPKDNRLTAVIPLGAEIIECKKKNYNTIDLLYVGTFDNRDLDKTILGFYKAKERLKDKIKMSYSLVGSGQYSENEKIKQMVSELGLTDWVTIYGYQPHNLLVDYYKKCNVGISFIPIKEYYQYQPPTKTFEYIMAGLFTIATATESNKDIVNEHNGLIIEDSSDSFADAIVTIYNKRNYIDSQEIGHSLDEYQWKTIVNKKLVKVLDDIENFFS